MISSFFYKCRIDLQNSSYLVIQILGPRVPSSPAPLLVASRTVDINHQVNVEVEKGVEG